MLLYKLVLFCCSGPSFSYYPNPKRYDTFVVYKEFCGCDRGVVDHVENRRNERKFYCFDF